jgi:hypothetical protein
MTLVALLRSLGPVGAAKWDSSVERPGCLQGTRVNILTNMISWAEDESSESSIYWLAGLAGTGKSTITKSFCQQMTERGNMTVLTFFASKSSAEQSDPFRMLYTFVYQLARADDSFCKYLLVVLREKVDVKDRPISEQVELLLRGPLRRTIEDPLVGLRSLLLVIDALDECMTVKGVKGHGLIPYLDPIVFNLPVKLLIASRMEHEISNMFELVTANKTPILLHKIAQTEVADDVHRILADGFACIVTKHQIVEPWPSQGDIDTLIRLTGHLLIFASTVIKYVSNERHSAQARLEQILENTNKLDRNLPFQQIDLLYTDILINSTKDENGLVDLELCDRIRLVLATILLLQEPLSVNALASLLLISESKIKGDVHALSSVLLLQENGPDKNTRVVRIFHPSLRDFLLERCTDPQFKVIRSQHELSLSLRCLTLLNNHLHEDICAIRDPTLANDVISDLPLRLQKYAHEALQYSCTYWIAHLIAVDLQEATSTLVSALSVFTHDHLQHWAELLSLLKQLPSVIRLLPQAMAWNQVC